MTTPPTRELSPACLTPVQPVVLSDLFLDAAQVVAYLRRSVAVGAWLDAYLFAAGLSQLVDDDLHPDPASLQRAAAYLRTRAGRTGTAAAVLADAGASGVRPMARTRRRRALLPLRTQLRTLVDVLAAITLDPSSAPEHDRRVRLLLDRSAGCAELLRDDALRLPAAFRSFDQHPDDLDRLAAATWSLHLAPDMPVCVVGVRTSGNYLAPLFAAALRRRGLSHVEVLTYRPHRALLGDEIEQLQRVSGAGGRVVVIDDPPGSGSSLATAATAVTRAGVDRSAVVIAACIFPDADPLPPRLANWTTVVLEWERWSVQARLGETAVAAALAEFVGPQRRVLAVRRTDAPRAARRAHVRAEYAVTLCGSDGRAEERAVVVEGAGLGWFGRHAIAVSDAMLGWTPSVLGFADGLLYSETAPPAVPPADASTAAQIADYCTYRHDMLPARRDPTELMRGRDPVWEVAAALLAGMFGRLAPLARPLLLEPLTRRLLRVDAPSVVDGDTGLQLWRCDPERKRLVKLAYSERAFSHLEAACYDPLFDLAGAATDPATPQFEALLREEYERLTGNPVRREAWLLYRLVHLWRTGRAGDADATTVTRGSALAVTQYLAELHLGDLAPSAGPLCALDLDGVLESDPLGYPVTTPGGTLAIRSLARHGYRPVLATGRSIADARELCRALGIAGAVAEYGTACYVLDGDQVVDLRTADQRVLLDRLRVELARDPAVTVDPRHEFAVRARCADGPLPMTVLARHRHAELTVVAGQAQSDITAAGLDKAAALRTLGTLLGGDATIALAVGDGPADVPMLLAARLGRAPANAAPEVCAAGVRIGRRSYQAGLSDAVAELVGHTPGGCATCRAPRVGGASSVLLRVLALRENGIGGLTVRTAELAAALARSAVSTRW